MPLPTRVIITGHFLWPDNAPIPRIGETIQGEDDSGPVWLKVTGVVHNPRLQTDGEMRLVVNVATKRLKRQV